MSSHPLFPCSYSLSSHSLSHTVQYRLKPMNTVQCQLQALNIALHSISFELSPVSALTKLFTLQVLVMSTAFSVQMAVKKPCLVYLCSVDRALSLVILLSLDMCLFLVFCVKACGFVSPGPLALIFLSCVMSC